MSELFEVPKTSPEIENQVYQEFKADMMGFVLQSASRMEEDQPIFLDANLAGAVTIVLTEAPTPATMILAGSFFRYECAKRELQLRGESYLQLEGEPL